MQTKEYVILGIVLIFLIFVLVTLDKIEKPLEEVAKLPKCEGNNVVISGELRSKVINFADEYVENGTGIPYFKDHYRFMSLEYSTVDCTFLVKYTFSYMELHDIMSVKVKAFSDSSFEVVGAHALLRPVLVKVTESEAVSLAKENNINYDYYNLEIDVDAQTFVYKFYKRTLTEGNIVVFEVDAQSKEVEIISHPPEVNPIV